MGAYERSHEANGSWCYIKRHEGDITHWIFRNSKNGKWLVANDESNIAGNRGLICSSQVAELPTKAGLAWQYWDGEAWQDDTNMTCTKVHSVVRPCPHIPSRYQAHLSCCEGQLVRFPPT